MVTVRKNYQPFTQLIFLFFILSYSSLNAQFFQNLSEFVCAQLFGNKDAPATVQQQFADTRQTFGLKETSSPVKYMRNNSFLNRLTSFTWSNTWINKKAWHGMDEKEKTFGIHHEVAHTAKQHPLIQISCAIISFLATTYLVVSFINPSFKNFPSSSRKYFITFFDVCSIAATTGIITSFVARECEKEADITAAQELCNHGKMDIVQFHIKKLKQLAQQKGNCYGIWFKSLPEQIAYLEAVLLKYENKNSDPV